MNKIRRVSWGFRLFFQIVFILIPILQITGWVYAPSPLHFCQNIFTFDVIPDDYHVMHQLDAVERMAGFMVSMIPVGINLFILYSLINLFRLYEQGEIFSIRNVNYIRTISMLLLLGQLMQPLYQFLMGVVLTWRNPPGFRFASVTLNQTNIGIILIAFLLILISWIMAEGYKLREEQQLTI